MRRSGGVCGQQGDVGNAADIHHDAVFVRAVQVGVMKCRYQGGTLTSGGDVPSTEVGHCGDAGALGNAIRIADLEGVGIFGLWAMAESLAVAANGHHGIG